MSRRYVIVGTGVAGLAAAEAIREEDPQGQITLVGDDPDGYYSRPGLAYYLNKTIPEKQLFPLSSSAHYELIPNRILAHVAQVTPNQHEIVLAGGRHMEYDRLLIATGSKAVALNFPGNDLQGVVKLYTLEDVRNIRKLAKRCYTAVVIGDGIIGIELAEGLAAYGVQVHIFMLGDRLWPMVLDETESRIIEQGLLHSGIRVHPETQLAEAIGREGVLSAVVTKKDDKIACQILGVAVGQFAQIELARQSGMVTERGIIVDEYLATSAEDIFAAGNVAQVRDSRTGTTWMDTLWATARRQGQVAGINMTGGHLIYTRDALFNIVRVGDIITSTIGTVEPDSLAIASSNRRNWLSVRQEEVDHEDKTNRVRVLIGERTIRGAIVMGDQTLAEPLFRMIQKETDISSIRSELAVDPERGIEVLARFISKELDDIVCSS